MSTLELPITSHALPLWDIMESIPIQDNGEPLVPVSVSPVIQCYPAYYKMGVNHAIPECFVRHAVFERLLQAATLLPDGIRLVVLDGWRPFFVQQYLFDTLLNYLRRRPGCQEMADEALYPLARSLVSPPRTNPDNPSPHLTGGSVDVTLCDPSGRLLNMGTVFDENSPLSWTAALEDEPAADQQALRNRRILFHVMRTAGFTNLPSEWWHYDYGNQLWAHYQQRPEAIYGATKPLALERLWNEYDSNAIRSGEAR